jgi:hypothetical protein
MQTSVTTLGMSWTRITVCTAQVFDDANRAQLDYLCHRIGLLVPDATFRDSTNDTSTPQCSINCGRLSRRLS